MLQVYSSTNCSLLTHSSPCVDTLIRVKPPCPAGANRAHPRTAKASAGPQQPDQRLGVVSGGYRRATQEQIIVSLL